jgi:hypothetical protein
MRREPMQRLTLRPNWAARGRAAWFATLIAGSLDLAYAAYGPISKGRSPVPMLQAIASGWQGRAAYDGGLVSAALGVLSHYGILFVIAAACVDLAMRHLPLLRHPLRNGIVLGIAIYLLMHFIVVPLSAAPFSLPHGPGDIVEGLLVHVALVGVPILYALRHVLAKAGWPVKEQT